jgi:hypothetical protein
MATHEEALDTTINREGNAMIKEAIAASQEVGCLTEEAAQLTSPWLHGRTPSAWKIPGL